MLKKRFVIVEKKRSPLKTIVIIISTIAAVGAAVAVAYYFLKDKCKSEILGRVDINGDGEADAIMLDTTGNGEIDTIILNTDLEEAENE